MNEIKQFAFVGNTTITNTGVGTSLVQGGEGATNLIGQTALAGSTEISNTKGGTLDQNGLSNTISQGALFGSTSITNTGVAATDTDPVIQSQLRQLGGSSTVNQINQAAGFDTTIVNTYGTTSQIGGTNTITQLAGLGQASISNTAGTFQQSGGVDLIDQTAVIGAATINNTAGVFSQIYSLDFGQSLQHHPAVGHHGSGHQQYGRGALLSAGAVEHDPTNRRDRTGIDPEQRRQQPQADRRDQPHRAERACRQRYRHQHRFPTRAVWDHQRDAPGCAARRTRRSGIRRAHCSGRSAPAASPSFPPRPT